MSNQASISVFKADLSRIQEKIHGKSQQLVRKVGQTLYNEMSSGGKYSPGTPIDTGFARGSWAANIGTPAAGSPGNEATAIAQVTGVVDSMNPGEVLYVTNNAPYIRRLEFNGHSKQAPDGFIRVAAAAIQPIVDEVAASLSSE